MKIFLATLMAWLSAMALAETFGVRQIARAGDPLEPSLQNEVEHALARAEAWLYKQPLSETNSVAAVAAGDVFGTNGLAAADIAIKLISSQKGSGWWCTPTNTVPTRIAVAILKGL